MCVYVYLGNAKNIQLGQTAIKIAKRNSINSVHKIECVAYKKHIHISIYIYIIV